MSNIEIRKEVGGGVSARREETIASANIPDRNGSWNIPGIQGSVRVEIRERDEAGIPRKIVLQSEGLKRSRAATKTARTVFLRNGEGMQRVSGRRILFVRPDVPGAEMAQEVIEPEIRPRPFRGPDTY